MIIVMPCLILHYQGKQNSTDEATNGKLNNNTEHSVETPKKEDGKQGGSPKEGEQSVETPKTVHSVEAPERDSEPKLETPKMDGDLPNGEKITNGLNGREDQLEEIKLD
jgi:hypothetical protein